MFRLTIATLSGFWNFQNQAKNSRNTSVRSAKIWPIKFLQLPNLKLYLANWMKVVIYLKAHMASATGLRYQRPDMGVGQAYQAK